jgi:holo-[acyl-carrier protein] synthase
MLDKIGIGIDLVKIEKFKKLEYKNNTDFYKNIFTSSEIKYCLKFSEPYEHFAGKFALKEAIIKSIGLKIPLISIITDHNNFQPIVKIKNSSDYSFMVTLSHEDEFAVAVVISEKL